MALRPRAAETPGAAAGAPSPAEAGQPCGALGRVLARTFRESKPHILVLGPLCGETVVYLAGRGARVYVEDMPVPDPLPQRRPGEEPSPVTPARLEQPDRVFDLVIAWEILDFVPPDRLAEIGAEIARVLRVGGQLIVFAHQKPPSDTAVIPRYRTLADDLVVREEPAVPPHRRYAHPNRDIERALSGLAVQGIQLQRNQMREIVASKAGVG